MSARRPASVIRIISTGWLAACKRSACAVASPVFTTSKMVAHAKPCANTSASVHPPSHAPSNSSNRRSSILMASPPCGCGQSAARDRILPHAGKGLEQGEAPHCTLAPRQSVARLQKRSPARGGPKGRGLQAADCVAARSEHPGTQTGRRNKAKRRSPIRARRRGSARPHTQPGTPPWPHRASARARSSCVR
jgi:hypothetical protein